MSCYNYRRKNNKPKGFNRRTKNRCPIKRVVNHWNELILEEL